MNLMQRKISKFGLPVSQPSRRRTLSLIPAIGICAFGLTLAQHGMAQPVVIDEWTTAQNVETPAAGGALDTAAANIASLGSVGGHRKVWVEETADPNDFRMRSQVSQATRIASHSEDSGVEGFQVLIWDGSNSVPTGPDDIVRDGLGIDLRSGCPAGAPQAISFTITGARENPIAITLDVFTNDNHWSTASTTNPAGAGGSQSITFRFDSDFSQGAGATGPVDFASVGAIRLRLDPNGNSNQFDIITPIVACGIDYGDAPFGLLAGNFYTTTASTKTDLTADGVKNNTQRGPHHTIGGPWMPDIAIARGQLLVNDTDRDVNGQQDTGASGDDNDGSDDEKGVFLPKMPLGNTMVDPNLGPVECDGLAVGVSEYCAAVRVANPLEIDAQVVGWVDFERNGVFDNNCSTTNGTVVTSTGSPSPVSGCERSAAAVRIGTIGLGDFGGPCSASTLVTGDSLGGPDFSTGNVPAHCEGIVVLVWDLSQATKVTKDATFSRFRITSDKLRGFFGSAGIIADVPNSPAPFRYQTDGEVEDHILDAGTLPVSIHAFESRYTDSGLVIEWGTVSETRTVGFKLWGDRGDGLDILTDEMVPATAIDIVRPQRYSVTIPGVLEGEISELAITAVDFDGKEDAYGFFRAGQAYGKKLDPAPIAWAQINDEVTARLQQRAQRPQPNGPDLAIDLRSDSTRGASPAAIAVDMRASGVGLHEVRWDELAAAGLDLNGISVADIAVTLKGEPVARDILSQAEVSGAALWAARAIRGGAETFGPGSVIRFWAEAPTLPDRLYVSDYSYRISIDPTKARPALLEQTKPKPGPAVHTEIVRENRDNQYSFASPLDDPWFAALLRANASNRSYTTVLEVSTELDASQPARIEAVVGGFTAYDVSPDHRVQLEVNGQIVADVEFDGLIQKSISAAIPPGLLQPGSNQVRVLAPGGTAAPFDLFMVDTIDIQYERAIVARQDRLLAERFAHEGGLTVSGLTTQDTVAYARTSADLVRLPREQFSRGSVRVPTVAVDAADYWISSAPRVLRAASIQSVPAPQLLDGVNADLLVIAHPAFLPLSPDENHPLNDYLTARTADGWNPAVFDITAIQQAYGHGMPLPGALNAFLAEADTRMAYSHVLLVGGDSYDYLDRLGLGSLSFIPTHYASTRAIKHTPSDNLLADLDGDGVADKALGRWPVRSQADLSAIVAKTLAWFGDPQELMNSAWIADSQDPVQFSFSAQVDMLGALLVDAGWDSADVSKILLDDVVPPAGVAAVDAARQMFFDQLETGRSLSGFIGHGAPSMWTFQGLLTPDDIGDLYNEGAPTLIGTLTCYTSYFVSPFSDTVAHRWMNGYREDAAGNPIPGVPNGAVAIHGAATLSNYGQNGWFASQVLERQLQGLTIGAAIQQVREIAGATGVSDQVINWTLLGDPTIRID